MTRQSSDFNATVPFSHNDTVGNTAGDRQALADRLRNALINVDRAKIKGRAGASKSTISRIFEGKAVKRITLMALAQALGVRQEWLTDGIGEMHEDGGPQDIVEHIRGSPSDTDARQLSMESLPPLTDAQSAAMVTCIISAANVMMAKNEPLSPLPIAHKAIGYFAAMASAAGTHNDSVLALLRATEADMKPPSQPIEGPLKALS